MGNKIQAEAGENIFHAVCRAMVYSNVIKETCTLAINGIELPISSTSNPKELCKIYDLKQQKRI